MSVLAYVGYGTFAKKLNKAPIVPDITQKMEETCEDDAATAKSLIDNGRPSKAMQGLDSSIKDCGNTPQFMALKNAALKAQRSANDHLSRAREYMDQGQLVMAFKSLDSAIAKDQDLHGIQVAQEHLEELKNNTNKLPEPKIDSSADLTEQQLDVLLRGSDEGDSPVPTPAPTRSQAPQQDKAEKVAS